MTSRDLIGDRFLVRCVRCAVVCVFQACPCLVVGRGNKDTAYGVRYGVLRTDTQAMESQATGEIRAGWVRVMRELKPEDSW